MRGCIEVTNGNPLFALEIARSAPVDDATGASAAPWDVPEDIQRVLSARLARLPLDAHRPLLAIAAMTQPTWELVVQVAGTG